MHLRKATIRCCHCDYVYQEQRQVFSFGRRLKQLADSGQTAAQPERQRSLRCPKCRRCPQGAGFVGRLRCHLRAFWRWLH